MTSLELYQEKQRKIAALENQIAEIEAQYHRDVKEIKARCTHRYPDGKSASDDGFMFASCKICGYFDL